MMARDKIGPALRAIAILLLGADAATIGFRPESLTREFAATGFAMWQAPVMAAILALAILLYAIPRTALLGAILVTGFLGGAICAHFRLGEIGSPPQLICLLLGAIAWGGVAAGRSRPWVDRGAVDRQA
ncbi:MAG: DoxX family protein [Proteobacteria bacterium]|nr:DoxX family protein [Pseudomonadota bacterium]